MDKISIKLLLVLLAVLSLTSFTACQSSGLQLGYSDGLPLEEARQKLEEKGIVFVDTIKQAADLAGFQVLTPSFIPDGFNFMHITVEKTGAVSSQPPKASRYIVSVYYTQREGFRLPEQSWFSLVQATSDLSNYRSEPVEICGKPARRELMTADNKLMISWQSDSTYYAVIGPLNDLLDEDAMEKIACSVINQ
jgi:hypothetical protein